LEHLEVVGLDVFRDSGVVKAVLDFMRHVAEFVTLVGVADTFGEERFEDAVTSGRVRDFKCVVAGVVAVYIFVLMAFPEVVGVFF